MNPAGGVGPLPFVDTHFHLWNLDHEHLRYDWLERAQHPVLGSIGSLARSYLLDDYLREIAGLDVAAAVHVQADASDPLLETEWLTAVAEKSGWPQAMVTFVDLESEGCADALARQSSFSRVRGVRDLRVRNLKTAGRQWNDPRLRRSLARLGRKGLHYELRMTYAETSDVIELLKGVEDVPVVLTHAGLPLDHAPEELRAWRRAIGRLSSIDFLHCKLSGFGMGHYLSRQPWNFESVRPLIMTCVEAFGTTRTFFGSNWPVDTLAVSYRDMIDTYRAAVAGSSADEQRNLLGGNAMRFYRLPATY